MPKTEAESKCPHKGYLMKDGALVCAECGEPSPSETWRANVYGVQSAEAK